MNPKKEEQKWGEKKTMNKTTDLIPTIPVIVLNINELNNPVKGQSCRTG